MLVAIGYIVCKSSRLLINSCKHFKIVAWCVLDNGGGDSESLISWIEKWLFSFHLCFIIHCLVDYCYDSDISTNINVNNKNNNNNNNTNDNRIRNNSLKRKVTDLIQEKESSHTFDWE